MNLTDLRMLSIEELRYLVRQRWDNGTYHEEGKGPETIETLDLPWMMYQKYRRAQLISVSRQIGYLRVDFLKEIVEENCLHTHPVSDRVIRVLRGTGEFFAKRNGTMIHRILKAGDTIFIPWGVEHTVFHGDHLLLEALHNPWVAIEDYHYVSYPINQISLRRSKD